MRRRRRCEHARRQRQVERDVAVDVLGKPGEALVGKIAGEVGEAVRVALPDGIVQGQAGEVGDAVLHRGAKTVRVPIFERVANYVQSVQLAGAIELVHGREQEPAGHVTGGTQDNQTI